MIANPTFFSVEQLPPSNIEAEESILGGIMLDPKALSRIVSQLPPEAFYIEKHRKIYLAAINLSKKGKPTDLLAIANYLEEKGVLSLIGGRSALANLIDRCVSAVNIDALAVLVLEKYIRRQVVRLGNEIAEVAHEREFEGENGNLLDIVKGKLEHLLDSSYCQPTCDPEEVKYNNLLRQIKEIEMSDDEPGLKVWKMQGLAKRTGRSLKELDQIHMKSLLQKSREPLKTFADLEQECETEDREWLLHGFLPKATTMLLHAEGGVGKTKLAYELAYGLLTGNQWSNYPTTGDSRRVLLYQTDESPFDTLQSLRARGFNTENTQNFRRRRGWSIDDVSTLIKDLQEFQPEFLMIDSLTSYSRYSIYSENDVEYARPLLVLAQLAAEYKCTILVIHHSSRGGNSRGTTAIFNAVSEVWGLKRDDKSADGTTRILEIEKSRSRRPTKYRLVFDEENFSWSNLGEVSELDSSFSPDATTRERISSFLLENANTTFESEEIQHYIGGDSSNVRRQLHRLHRDGLICRKLNTSERVRFYTYFIKKDEIRNILQQKYPPCTPSTHPLHSVPALRHSALPERVSGDNQENGLNTCTPLHSVPALRQTLPKQGVADDGVQPTPLIHQKDDEKDFSQKSGVGCTPALRQPESLPEGDFRRSATHGVQRSAGSGGCTPSSPRESTDSVENNTLSIESLNTPMPDACKQDSPGAIAPGESVKGFILQGGPKVGNMHAYTGKDKELKQKLGNRYQLQIVAIRKSGKSQQFCCADSEGNNYWLNAYEISGKQDRPLFAPKTHKVEHRGRLCAITKFLNATVLCILSQAGTEHEEIILPPMPIDTAVEAFREIVDGD